MLKLGDFAIWDRAICRIDTKSDSNPDYFKGLAFHFPSIRVYDGWNIHNQATLLDSSIFDSLNTNPIRKYLKDDPTAVAFIKEAIMWLVSYDRQNNAKTR